VKEIKCSKIVGTLLLASPIQLHSHENTSELLSQEMLEAQRSLTVSLYRTLKYNEVSDAVSSNMLGRELSCDDVARISSHSIR
jgi:hypothetical protein